MKLHKQLPAIKAKGARVFAISANPDDIEPTAKDNNLSFRFLADPGLDAVRAWGVPIKGEIATWASFVVDEKGVVKHAKLGYSKDLAGDILAGLK